MANVLSKIAGDNQIGKVNSRLLISLSVYLDNGGGSPVSGVTVTWAINSVPGGAAGQSLSAASSITDISGHASVQFTVGNTVGAYTVTATVAGATGSPATFTANAYAPTTYLIETVNTTIGLMRVRLQSNLSTLTVPSLPTIIVDQDTLERVDALAGVQDTEQLDVNFVEDYSTYSDGFWFHAVSQIQFGGFCYLQITVDEGSGETPFFFGTVVPGATPLNEVNLFPTKPVRRGTLHLQSFLGVLQQTATVTVNANMAAWGVYTAYATVNYATIKQFFAAALATATGQSYSASDVTMVGNDDFQFTYDGVNWEGLSGASTCWFPAGLIQSTGSFWAGRHPLVWELMTTLCLGFGVLPRYRYDTAAGRHKIDLLTRGRSYSTNITLGTPKQSTLIAGTPVLVQRIQVTGNATGVSGGGTTYYNVPDQSYSQTQPGGWQADLQIGLEASPQSLSYGGEAIYGVSGGVLQLYTGVRYWDYGAGAYIAAPVIATYARHDLAVCYYYGARLGLIKRIYQRTYFGLKGNDGSTNSQANVTLMRNTQINDGVGLRSFYAEEVHKNAATGLLYLQLREV